MDNYDFSEWTKKNIPYHVGDANRYKNNGCVKALLKEDFLEDVTVDLEHKHICHGKGLFSISRVLRPVNELGYINVPPIQLDIAKNLGSALMSNLEYFWENKVKNIEDMYFNTPDERVMFTDFVKFFKENKIKILSVEKFVKSGQWCGYIDVVANWNNSLVLLEIKTRSKLEIRNTDLIQANYYYNLTGIPVILVVYDRNKRQFKLQKISNMYKFNNQFQISLKEFNHCLSRFNYPKLERIKYLKQRDSNNNIYYSVVK